MKSHVTKTNFFLPLAGLLFLMLFFQSCSDPGLEYSVKSTLNPNKIAPLTAELTIKTNKPCRASIRVLGNIPFGQAFDQVADSLIIPVIGLYPGNKNKVVLSLDYEGGKVEDTLTIVTEPLPIGFPDIKVQKAETSLMEPGMHLCDLHFANNGDFHSYPMIFDNDGAVRWYLDLHAFQSILWPIQRISNGNLLLGGRNVIFELDMLGKQMKRLNIDERYWIHHELLELPDGNFLVAVKREGNFIIAADGESVPSINDLIVLVDGNTAEILKEWDLANHLDVSRMDINSMGKGNWLHINGMAFDPRDSTILVSGKNQGMAKITWDDDLKWILAPKKNWGRGGREGKGKETQPFLLTAVNSKAQAYDQQVQLGEIAAEDFDFSWGQHSPMWLPNYDLLVFDNGNMRNFKKEQYYSRAVQYRIDEPSNTVQQIWQYGKEKGMESFSMLISDVDYLPKTKNILVTSGYVLPGLGKIAEVTYPDGEEVFVATLEFKTLNGTREFIFGQLDILYRSERFDFKY